jgi:hypothetical protein
MLSTFRQALADWANKAKTGAKSAASAVVDPRYQREPQPGGLIVAVYTRYLKETAKVLFLKSLRKHVAGRNESYGRRQAWRARPMIEGLEQRTLLSITFSGPGNSGLATITGGPGADKFIVQLKPTDATMIEFSDDGGTTFVDAALAGITGVNVFGLAGNDQLIVDAGNGLVGQAMALPISYDGGMGENLLTLQGNATGTLMETFTLGTSAGSGMLTTTDGTISNTISLTNVGKIQDTMTADTLTVNGNAGNNFIHIHNGPIVNGFTTDTIQFRDVTKANGNLDDKDHGQGDDQGDGNGDDQGDGNGDDQGDGNGDDQGDGKKGDDKRSEDDDLDATGTLESISFANKTNVVVNGQDGNDLFLLSVGTAADGLQSLTLDGGAGTNVAAIRSSPATVSLTLKNVQVVGADPDSFFIEEMYEERLGRVAEQAEVSAWMNVLQSSAGRNAVVLGIEQSPEARTLMVQNIYVRYLGRAAVGGEEQPWVRLMLSGETEERITAAILASPEFYARAQTLSTTGSPDQRYVQALYQAILNRSATSAEVSGWVSQLPALGRFGVALGFLESNEFRTGAVTLFYTTLLQRSPDAAGLAGWVRAGQDLEHVRESFEMSPEFFGMG